MMPMIFIGTGLVLAAIILASPIRDEREHETDGETCWCHPRKMVPCGQCEEGDEDCWRCGGCGLIPATDGDMPPFIFLHNGDGESIDEETTT